MYLYVYQSLHYVNIIPLSINTLIQDVISYSLYFIIFFQKFSHIN